MRLPGMFMPWLLTNMTNTIGQDKQICIRIFSYPSIKTCVLGAQKNRLIETVLLSNHKTCLS